MENVLEFLKVLGRPLARAFDYRGTISRGEFFAWWLLTMLVGLVCYLAVMGIFQAGNWPSWLWSLEGYIAWAPGMLLCIPTWAAMNRRLRDAGLNPNLLWINTIPLGLFLAVFIPNIQATFLYLLLQGNFVVSLVVILADLILLSRPTNG